MRAAELRSDTAARVLKVCVKCLRTVPAERLKAHQAAHRRRELPASGRRGSSSSRGYRAARKQAFERDGWRCVACGKAPPAVRLEAHHLDGDWRNNALHNLATVCQDHNPRGGSTGRK